MTDANNHTTSYAYDFLERLVSTTYPDGSTETLTLDRNGNVMAVKDRRGNTTNYQYDKLNRLVKITDPAGGIITMQYDPLGQTTGFTYDPVGNRIARTRPDGTGINYSYDNNNRLVGITYPDGLNISYTYNGLNQLQSVSDAVYTATFTYDELGNIIGEQLPNSVTVSYAYDNIGRLTSLQHIKSDTVLAGVEYTLDNLGNRLFLEFNLTVKLANYADSILWLTPDARKLLHAGGVEFCYVGNNVMTARRLIAEAIQKATGIKHPDFIE